jgi:hypothetical protein
VRRLVINNLSTDIFFSKESTQEEIIFWAYQVLYNMNTNVDAENIFMLNEPMSCGITNGLKNTNNPNVFLQFIIRGDEDYKIIDIIEIETVL